jgi:alkylated DNA repair dioxygenase AlkB
MAQQTTDVPGLFLVSEFLSEKEEKKLIKKINKGDWQDNRAGDRKVQVYGPYHDRAYKIIPGKYSEHPKWLKKLAKKLWKSVDDSNRDKLLDEKTCEVFINEYKDFNGLHYHFDHLVTYDENIYGVSLNCDAFMGFKNGSKVHKVSVPARSLYIMSGKSRDTYKHGIKRGWIDGKRISITFRTIR